MKIFISLSTLYNYRKETLTLIIKIRILLTTYFELFFNIYIHNQLCFALSGLNARSNLKTRKQNFMIIIYTTIAIPALPY